MSWSIFESTVQQFAAHGTVGYTQGKPHRATLSGELMAVVPLRFGRWQWFKDASLVFKIKRIRLSTASLNSAARSCQFRASVVSIWQLGKIEFQQVVAFSEKFPQACVQ
jgi:hypothetical protein